MLLWERGGLAEPGNIPYLCRSFEVKGKRAGVLPPTYKVHTTLRWKLPAQPEAFPENVQAPRCQGQHVYAPRNRKLHCSIVPTYLGTPYYRHITLLIAV